MAVANRHLHLTSSLFQFQGKLELEAATKPVTRPSAELVTPFASSSLLGAKELLNIRHNALRFGLFCDRRIKVYRYEVLHT